VLMSKLKYYELEGPCKVEGEVAECLNKWRLEIATLDQEVPEFVLPRSLIRYLQANPQSDILEASKAVLQGFVPPYVQQYRDKLQLIVKQAAASQSQLVTPTKQAPAP